MAEPQLTATPLHRRQLYEKVRTQALNERQGAGFDAHWREIADFILPRRTQFQTSERNRGDRRNHRILDSSATFAAQTLRSGLHAGLTSPARPWMRLTTPDPQLSEFGPVKEWLHLVTERMRTVFAQSNLYNVLPTIYGDMGTFATAATAVLEDSRDLFRCYSYPLGSYAVLMDARGRVNTFVRDLRLTVRQVVEQFAMRDGNPRDLDWSRISDTVRSHWFAGDYANPVDVTWVVMANPWANPSRLESRYLPYVSCWYERGNGEDRLLRESGFRQFPVLVPRWDVQPEDIYGTDCPGMTALGDVKQLNLMQRRKAQAIEKTIDPPLVGPVALMSQKTSLLAGDITYVDERDGNRNLRPLHEVRADLQWMLADIQDVRYRISRAFHEDLFLMLARSDAMRGSQPITAREVEERHEEKMLALGPVLERTNDELLDPLIDRTFDLMDRAGMLPEAPQELQGVDLRVEYISILAQAQKLVGVIGQDRFLGSALPLVEAFPSVRHKINVFQIVDNYAEILGVDPRVVRPNEEANALAEAEAQAQQAAADAEQAMAMARAAKDASAAPMGQDSALDRLVQGVT